MKRPVTSDTQTKVAIELARLVDLDRAGCITCWRQTFRATPPKYLSLPFMRKALAYELQVAAFGGLSPQTRRALLQVSQGMKLSRSAPGRMNPGTRLLRVWNGHNHEVEVLDDGFRWRERHYRSLSAIARAITGVRWSGPRFFGLNDKVRAKPDGIARAEPIMPGVSADHPEH